MRCVLLALFALAGCGSVQPLAGPTDAATLVDAGLDDLSAPEIDQAPSTDFAVLGGGDGGAQCLYQTCGGVLGGTQWNSSSACTTRVSHCTLTYPSVTGATLVFENGGRYTQDNSKINQQIDIGSDCFQDGGPFRNFNCTQVGMFLSSTCTDSGTGGCNCVYDTPSVTNGSYAVSGSMVTLTPDGVDGGTTYDYCIDGNTLLLKDALYDSTQTWMR